MPENVDQQSKMNRDFQTAAQPKNEVTPAQTEQAKTQDTGQGMTPPGGGGRTAAFDQAAMARDAQEREKKEAEVMRTIHDTNITRSPVSKLEKDALEKQRETLIPAPSLTPGGMREQTVNQQVSAEREARIAYIKERLNKQQNRARDDFNRNSDNHRRGR